MHGHPPLPFLCRPAFCPVCVTLATLSRSQLLPYAVRADALQCPFAQCPFAQREVLFRAVPFCTERGTLSHSALLQRGTLSYSALLHRKRYSSAQCPFAQKEVLFHTVPFCTKKKCSVAQCPFAQKEVLFRTVPPFAQKEVLFRTVPFCTDRGTLSLFLSFLIGTTGCSRHHNPAARTSLLVRHNTHWYTKR